MHPLAFIDEELARLDREGLRRENVSLDGPTGARVRRRGRTLVNFSSNDYLGLANDPRVRRGAADAALTYGGGAGASRLLGGDLPIHRALEQALAELKGTAAALIFSSGYAANLGILPALAGAGDAIFSDALNHASIVDGTRLARAEHHVYAHGDLQDLERLLAASRARRKLVVTESLFSMDGDVAPLAELAALADAAGAILMVDEAHATGVWGDGAGLCREFGLADRVPVQLGTFGKALGAAGAYVAGDRRLIDFLLNRARSYVFSTAPAPAACGAALAAIGIVASAEGELLRASLADRAARLGAALRGPMARGAPPARQIVPIQVGTPEAALHASEQLEAQGFLVRAVRPPSVPPGTSRLRLCVSAAHTLAEIDGVAAAVRAALPNAWASTSASGPAAMPPLAG